MDNRTLKIVGIGLIILTLMLVFAALGVGVVYAASHVIKPLTPVKIISAEADPNAGVIITSVDPEGPAAQAGVVRADILLEIDEQPIVRTVDLAEIILEHEPGDDLELTILHGDDLRTLSITLGERNDQAYLGINTCCGKDEFRIIERMPLNHFQTIVIEVVPGSPADEAGLEKRDIILSVNGEELTADYNLATAIAGYEPGDLVSLEIERADQEEPIKISLELSEHPDDSDKPYLGVTYSIAPAMRLPGELMPFDHFEFQLPGDSEEFKFEDRFKLPEGMPPLKFFDREQYEGIESGVIIVEVIEDSPASQAEIQSGDVITAINGESLEDPQSLVDKIGSYDPGDEITLKVYHPDAENEFEVEIKLGEHPDDPEKGFLGVVPLPLLNFEHFHRESDAEGNQPFFFKYLPFDTPYLDKLPFDLDNLPLDQLPFDFDFEFDQGAPQENEA